MSHEHEENNPADDPTPLQDRARRSGQAAAPLPVRPHHAIKYQKRRAGDDVIDLGMGNPSDPPEELVVEKARRGGPRSAQSRLLQGDRHS